MRLAKGEEGQCRDQQPVERKSGLGELGLAFSDTLPRPQQIALFRLHGGNDAADLVHQRSTAIEPRGRAGAIACTKESDVLAHALLPGFREIAQAS